MSKRKKQITFGDFVMAMFTAPFVGIPLYFNWYKTALVFAIIFGILWVIGRREEREKVDEYYLDGFAEQVIHAVAYADSIKRSFPNPESEKCPKKVKIFLTLIKKLLIVGSDPNGGLFRFQVWNTSLDGEEEWNRYSYSRAVTREDSIKTVEVVEALFRFMSDTSLSMEEMYSTNNLEVDKNILSRTILENFKNELDNDIINAEVKSDNARVQVATVLQDNVEDIYTRNPLAGFLATKDRYKHQYIIGKTGSGKTVLLRHQITQDIHNGHGVVLITPERGLIDDVLSYIPKNRIDDVVYFNPADDTAPVIGFNPFDTPPRQNLTQKAGELETIFIRALGDMGVKMRPLLSNSIYALIQGGLALDDFPKLIDPYDNSHRNRLLARGVLDERTQDFFEKYDKSTYYKGAYEPIINRLDTLLRPPLVNVLTTSALNFSHLLNKRKSIILCNLSSLRGMQAEIVGQLLLATFQQTFFQRDAMEARYLQPYFFYMDEFQTYATANEQSLKDFLTRARKYKVGIVMAHQTIKDIPPSLSASIFGNCGTLVGMLMSSTDAKKFSKESQLKNFDDWGDEHGTRAHLQLQNFEPGMCAIVTPKNKKAFIARVPERPVFEKTYTIESLIQYSKERYGTTPKARPQPQEKSQSEAPIESSTGQQPEDDFDFEIS